MTDIQLRGSQGDAIGAVVRNEWYEDGTTLLLESALENIREEIAGEWLAGKLRPFVEGEPIGMMRPVRPFTPEPETPEARWVRVQREIKHLRQKNNRALALLLELGV